MSCSTCGAEMRTVGGGNLWCPRCGTLQVYVVGDLGLELRDTHVPELVELCRRYEAAVFPDGVGQSLWGRVGIAGAVRREG